MADPQTAALTQLRNIQTKTGQTIAQLHAALAATGLAKAGERRAWLMEHQGLGYGDANAVALLIDKPLPNLKSATPTTLLASVQDSHPLDAIYTGAKAHLRPLHEAVIEQVRLFGPFDEAPKKATVSLRRKRQFALLGPATKDLLEIGLNHKALPVHPRLKLLPPGGMCQGAVRIASLEDVDARLVSWLRLAYDAAG